MSQVQTVKEAINIVEVIGERIDLNRSGGHFKACCPFHSEKSPSFFVSESMQRYKCFGCGESGDVITFLEKYEGMTFIEALEYLANRAGIVLQKMAHSPADDERKVLLEILDLAREYYHYLLTEHAVGEPGREYLKNRGVTSESVTLFQIGFAKSDWDGLFTYLTKKKKYDPQLIEKTGLCLKGNRGGYYDRFRNRLMFPLKNHRGQVVGFSGRVLDPTVKEAKYINSPETSLYHKSEMLFGYAELLQHIRTAKSVIVTEGELDVIASTQAHVNNVVAVKGSVLTTQHAQLIKRVAQKVILSLDTDSAGIEATKRAIRVLQPEELELRVAQIPAGKDPDELVKQDPSLWRDAVKKTLSIYAFLIEQALRVHDASTGEGKRQVMQEVGPVLAEMTHAVEQDFYIKMLAQKLSVREELVREDIRRAANYGPKGYLRVKKQEKEQEGTQEQAGKPADKKNAANTQTTQPKSKRSRLETYLAFLLFQFFLPPNNELQRSFLPTVSSDLQALAALGWENQTVYRLVEKIGEMVDSHISQTLSQPEEFGRNPILLDSIARTVAEDQADLIMQIAYNPKALNQLEHAKLEDEWRGVMKQLIEIGVRDKITHLTQELKALDDKLELTPEEEVRQQQLLQDVVKLRKGV